MASPHEKILDSIHSLSTHLLPNEGPTPSGEAGQSYSLLHQVVRLTVDLDAEAMYGFTEITFSCSSLFAIPQFRIHARTLQIQSVMVDQKQANFVLKRWPLYTDISTDQALFDVNAALMQGGKDLRTRITPDLVSDLALGELLIINPFYMAGDESSMVTSTLIKISYSVTAPNKECVLFTQKRGLVICGMPNPTPVCDPERCTPSSVPTVVSDTLATQCSSRAPPQAHLPLHGNARYWIPCVDRVSEIGTWDLSFKFQSPALVLCSGTIDTNRTDPEQNIYSFTISDPISAPMISLVVSEALDCKSIQMPDPVDASRSGYEIAIYAPETYSEYLEHASSIIPALFNFYSRSFGDYPFISFKRHNIVFLDILPSLPGPGHAAAGFTFLDASWLCPSDCYSRTVELRRALMQQVALQWIGCWVVPKTSLDFWCIIGLSQFMAAQFYLNHFGRNEYRYRLKADVQRLASMDIQMPPLHYWPHNSVDFLTLKSAMVIYMLDKRMSKVASSCGIMSCIPKILSSRTLSSNGLQRWVRRESSIDGLRSFWTEWIENSGVPKIEISYSQNNGRQVIEFELAQSNTSVWGSTAGIRPIVFSGCLTVHVLEIDDVVYTHQIEFSRPAQHFEVRFNSRYKYKKIMARSGFQSKVDQENTWASGLKDDVTEHHRWIKWVLVDPEMEWSIFIVLKQPDFKWIQLYQQSASVATQFDVITNLIQFPTVAGAAHLMKIAQDAKVFCKIRCDAIMALVRFARLEFQWIGLDSLIVLLDEFAVSRSSSTLLDHVPKVAAFKTFEEWIVFKAVLMAFSIIKNDKGTSPVQIVCLLFRFLQVSESGKIRGINQSELTAFLIKCLSKAILPIQIEHFAGLNALWCSFCRDKSLTMTKPLILNMTEVLDMGSNFLISCNSDEVQWRDRYMQLGTLCGKVPLEFKQDDELVDDAISFIERIRIAELLTSIRPEIMCNLLTCLCQWMMAGIAPVHLGVFLECTDEPYALCIREVAFQSIFLLFGFLEMPVMRHLLLVIEQDPCYSLRRSLVHSLVVSARMAGAPERATDTKKVLLRMYREMAAKIIDQVKQILDSDATPQEIQDGLLEFYEVLLAPPAIRLKVKAPALPPPPAEASHPMSPKQPVLAVGKSWQPPYLGKSPNEKMQGPGPTVMNAAIAAIEALKHHKSAAPFLLPVLPEVPGYYEMVRDPMDLQCVEKRNKNGHYQRLDDLFSDVEKIFINCRLFNPAGSAICEQATRLQRYCEDQVKQRAINMLPDPQPFTLTEAQCKKIKRIITHLRSQTFSPDFLKPVTGIAFYHEMIEHPMDLGTIKAKFDHREYPNLISFEHDMLLMLKNCFAFNAPQDPIYKRGKELETAFHNVWKKEFPGSRIGLHPIGGQGASVAKSVEINGSLCDPATRTSMFSMVLQSLVAHPESFDFRVPVDPDALNIPYYRDIIKNPMDLETIKTKIESYPTEREFLTDLLLILRNAITFNKQGAPVYESAFNFYAFIKSQWLKYFGVKDFPALTPHESKARKTFVKTKKPLRHPLAISPTFKIDVGSPIESEKHEMTLDFTVEKRLNFVEKSKKQETRLFLNQNSEKYTKIIKKLLDSKLAAPFSRAVDPIRDGVPHYFDIVKHPMDLSLVQQKQSRGEYETIQDLEADVNLVFQNCFLFNGKDHPFSKQANALKTMFANEIKSLYKQDLSTARKLLAKLRKCPNIAPFLWPVDPVLQNVPTYLDVIKNPMDVSTVQRKLQREEYKTLNEFIQDVNLIFDNCFLFNNAGDPVYLEGQRCKRYFEAELEKHGEPAFKKPRED